MPTIVIDAGHGGEDGGAIGNYEGIEVIEKHVNLAIACYLRDLLEANGYTGIMTRERDELLYDRNVEYQGRKKVLDLAARLHIGQNTPNAVFVSVHMNAFPQKQYSGLQVYYSKNNTFSSTLASCIQQTVREQLQPFNGRKIKAATSDIYLLDHLRCPAVLVECGFLSNEQECRLLDSKEYQQKLAFLLFLSIHQSLQGREDFQPSKSDLVTHQIVAYHDRKAQVLRNLLIF